MSSHDSCLSISVKSVLGKLSMFIHSDPYEKKSAISRVIGESSDLLTPLFGVMVYYKHYLLSL